MASKIEVTRMEQLKKIFTGDMKMYFTFSEYFYMTFYSSVYMKVVKIVPKKSIGKKMHAILENSEGFRLQINAWNAIADYATKELELDQV